ncbi:hypothetical protein L1987_33736 [Smallanthus sonchifolius]|uniref:Uncharacterized protein n=1 Tax=Smallanthus sonchifolius TaxID=185202 RepID=A0ACB9HRB9_9ASTR|nr:hypothetical protein L1987_33736 [Smallanthus sonchifolius]
MFNGTPVDTWKCNYDTHDLDDNPYLKDGCGDQYASYDQGRFSDVPFIPISLMWTLPDQFTCCSHAYERRLVVDMFNGTPVDTWTCSDSRYNSIKGNPYLIGGCKNFITYEAHPTEECKRCHDSGGYCRTEEIYDVDDSFFSENSTCYYQQEEKRTSLGVILVAKAQQQLSTRMVSRSGSEWTDGVLGGSSWRPDNHRFCSDRVPNPNFLRPLTLRIVVTHGGLMFMAVESLLFAPFFATHGGLLFKIF